jgi:peptide/nickel transport system ATP-binding protein
MKSGAFVEGGPVGDVVDHPQHPYTQKLLGAIPELGPWEDPALAQPETYAVSDVPGLDKEASHG